MSRFFKHVHRNICTCMLFYQNLIQTLMARDTSAIAKCSKHNICYLYLFINCKVHADKTLVRNNSTKKSKMHFSWPATTSSSCFMTTIFMKTLISWLLFWQQFQRRCSRGCDTRGGDVFAYLWWRQRVGSWSHQWPTNQWYKTITVLMKRNLNYSLFYTNIIISVTEKQYHHKYTIWSTSTDSLTACLSLTGTKLSYCHRILFTVLHISSKKHKLILSVKNCY